MGWGGHPQSSRSLKRWAGGGGLLLRGDTTHGCISVPGTKASNGTSLRPGLPHTPSLVGPGTTLEMWPRCGREGTPLQTWRQPELTKIKHTLHDWRDSGEAPSVLSARDVWWPKVLLPNGLGAFSDGGGQGQTQSLNLSRTAHQDANRRGRLSGPEPVFEGLEPLCCLPPALCAGISLVPGFITPEMCHVGGAGPVT